MLQSSSWRRGPLPSSALLPPPPIPPPSAAAAAVQVSGPAGPRCGAGLGGQSSRRAPAAAGTPGLLEPPRRAATLAGCRDEDLLLFIIFIVVLSVKNRAVLRSDIKLNR